jgi:hypothetical protein
MEKDLNSMGCKMTGGYESRNCEKKVITSNKKTYL